MISIPFYTVLFAYLIFLCIFVIFSLINFYHIIATSSLTFVSFTITFLVFALTILTLYFTWQIISQVNWSQNLILFDTNWF